VLSGEACVLHATPPTSPTVSALSVFRRILAAEVALCLNKQLLSHLRNCLTGSAMYVPAKRVWHDGVSLIPLHALTKDDLVLKYAQLRGEYFMEGGGGHSYQLHCRSCRTSQGL
jgi:hypothetical protein